MTVTADDITSGIDSFKYSYIKSEGVSDVNKELIDEAIENAKISYKDSTAIATFYIPKLILESENQFNGTVEFTAFDKSQNSSGMADEERIIVDNIKPSAQIIFNTPVSTSGNVSYYAGSVNASVIISEANFFEEDVEISVTRNGVPYSVNTVWNEDSVDVHTGRITLTQDGDYVITVNYTDRSSNRMDSYVSRRLTIDTVAPTVKVTNVKNYSANLEEPFSFTITASDVNINKSSFTPVLTAIVREADGSYLTREIPLGSVKTVSSGQTYSFTVDNLKEDAVYSLTCALEDMSGNEYSGIMLDDGNEYEKVVFSINRNGSTFTVNEATRELVDQYYVYGVKESVVIDEINVDPVENYIVNLNGKPLREGVDYVSIVTNNENEWSKRSYIIDKSVFEEEGEYTVIVESVDKAETTSFSDIKNLKVTFVVDKKAPVLTISGLEDSGRYQIEEQTVTVIPTDDGGKLNSFKAVILDSAGNEKEVRFAKSDDELISYLSENDGKITFTIPEGLEHDVRIICSDCAVNADGEANTYDETFKKVTVSQSAWVIFYANKPLFYCLVGGVVLLSAAMSFLIVFIKRKKK